jgi:uncharacterized protein
VVELVQHQNGILLPVRVHAGARRNAVTGIHDGALKIAVTQAAEKGKANKAVIRVLCEHLKLRPTQVELQSGSMTPQKRFIVREIPLEQLRQRIAMVLE